MPIPIPSEVRAAVVKNQKVSSMIYKIARMYILGLVFAWIVNKLVDLR